MAIQAVSSAQRALFRTSCYLRVVDQMHRRSAARIDRKEGSALVVVATTGHGNIGDQAMLEAVAASWHGPVVAFVESASAFQGAVNADGQSVKFVVAPGLASGRHVRTRRSSRRFWSEVASAARVYIIGADIMDGSYDRREAYLRWSIVDACARAGIDARVLGFSWSGSADLLVERRVSRLDPRVVAFLRDRRSLERFLAVHPSCTAESCADVAFTLSGVSACGEVDDWVAHQRQLGFKIVVVNISGLIFSSGGHERSVAQSLEALAHDGFRIVLLPHVIRDSDSDMQACRSVYAAAGEPDWAFLVETLLSPSQVRGLTEQVDAVFTGRMHLSILALTVGVPVCVMSTHGKVEGLLAAMALEEFLVDGPESVGQALTLLVPRLVNDRSFADEVSARISVMREAASLNFSPRMSANF